MIALSLIIKPWTTLNAIKLNLILFGNQTLDDSFEFDYQTNWTTLNVIKLNLILFGNQTLDDSFEFDYQTMNNTERNQT